MYFIPLVGPHYVWLTGEHLLRSTGRRAAQAPAWVALEWAVALAAQLLFLAALRRSRRAPRRLRAILALCALILLTPAVNMALLYALPVRFLIETNTAPEASTLPDHCRVADVDLAPATAAIYPDRQAPLALLVRRHPAGRHALLQLPSCGVIDLDVPTDAEIASWTSGGALLWTARRRTADPPSEWFVTSAAGTATIDGAQIPPRTVPTLLDDGETVAWMEAGQPPQIALLRGGSVRRIPAADAPSGSVGPLTGAGPDGPFRVSVLGTGATQWLVLDGTGRVVKTLPAPDVVQRFSHVLHPTANGWIAWDTYLEDGRYTLAWTIDGTLSKRELPKGLGFTAVAVDGGGRYVAASATSGLNIGGQRDEVFLLRVSDGAELFRRYAPKYSRASVALPGGRFFAVGEIVGTRPAVRVYRLP